MAVYDSQPRTLQEYTRVVAASGVEVLPCVGEFVFVVEAAIELRMVIGGKSFKLAEGDHIRVERFRDLELHNLRSDVDITVRVIVGFGEFDRRIIRGEITSVPGLLGADGTYRPDTRYELPLSLVKKPGTGETVNAGALVKTLYTFPAGSTWRLGDDNPLYFDPAADSRVLVHRLGTGGANSQMYALDVQGGSVVKLFEWHSFGSADDGVAWDSEFYYLAMTTYEGGTYQRGNIYRRARYLGSSWSLLYQDPVRSSSDAAGGIAIIGSELFFLAYGGNWSIKKINKTSGALIAEKNLSDILPGGFIVDGRAFPYRGQVWIADNDSGDIYHKVDTDLTYAGATGSDFTPDGAGACAWYYFMIRATDDDTIKLYEIENQTYPILGIAYDRQCGAGRGLLSAPDYLEANRSSAAVQVINSGPTALVIGEVIKLALEWYSARSVTSDYMDHVFGVEIISALSGGRGNPRRQVVQANGRSFAAASIPDAFSVTLPAQIKLTLDNGLEYE